MAPNGSEWGLTGEAHLTEPLRTAQQRVTQEVDTLIIVLRIALICASLGALVVPAAAVSMSAAPGDGSLVVKNASAPRGTPVVALTITGAVWGHIGAGRIVIDDATPNDNLSPEVTGAGNSRDVANSDTARAWSGVDFKFRAVGGRYTILIYGSAIDVVAFGSGHVVLTGVPDSSVGDGTYSLNGESFRSLPGAPAKQQTIGVGTTIG